ncbi:diaminopimelate decarboxylase [Candidatus Sumerlaeota bacterium]|nr:diaminopimelate decarboxylase [Candidatus Sumerlaeota bacterium]
MKVGFYYQGSDLMVDGVPLRSIARQHGTPIYVYSGGIIAQNYRRIASQFAKMDAMIAYSVKSNSSLAILKLLKNEGAAFDIVSGGELERVRKVGVKGDRIIFAGVGKTKDEMRVALAAGVKEFNLESEAEAHRLNEVAKEMGRIAPVAIRVNPDVDAKTHKYISTGKAENKFGVSMQRAIALGKDIRTTLKNLNLQGLHTHIGSQILDSSIHPRLVKKMVGYTETFMRETGAQLTALDFGGGFGIAYEKGQKPLDLKPFAKALAPELKRLGLTLRLEPGRSIIGNSGVLLTEVQYIKQGDKKTFVIFDASMTELIRPTLYEAHHEIQPVTKRRGKMQALDFVGPVCESTDFIAKDRMAVLPHQGDVLAIMDAGAYGFVMASNYNTRPRPAEVLVVNGKAKLVRKRDTFEDIVRNETF